MAVAPWIVSDALWKRVEPLLPRRERRFRYPGRKRLPEREALQGILFVLHTGIAWRHLPLALGFGSVRGKRGGRISAEDVRCLVKDNLPLLTPCRIGEVARHVFPEGELALGVAADQNVWVPDIQIRVVSDRARLAVSHPAQSRSHAERETIW
jgi:hypothetical protein